MRKTPYIGISRKDAPQGKTYSFQMRFLEVKAIDGGAKIRIKGFASTPEVDRYDDIVNPGAFANAMTKYMANPVVLLGHDPNKVLGQVVEYTLSAQGLEVTAELNNDIDNTFHNIMEKNLRGFSIGYRCLAANYKEEGNREIREIMELDLVEISVVSTPANPGSLFTMAKSFKLALGEMELKKSEGCDEDDDEEKKKKEKAAEGEGKEGEHEEKEGEGEGGEPPIEQPKTGEEGDGGETPPPPADDSGEGKTTPVKGE
jgi:HK97 family phage prohead protease